MSSGPAEPKDTVVRLPDGRDLAVRSYGDPDGRPVVMLHGTPGSRLMFAPAHRAAERLGLRLLCPDRPGVGRSSPHRGRTLATFAADIEAMLAAFSIDRVVLFGVSGGAPYATVAAAQLGVRVVHLMLVSPMGPIADLGSKDQVSFGHRAFFLSFGQQPLAARPAALAAAAWFRWAPHRTHKSFARLAGEPDQTILLRPHVEQHVAADTREAIRQGVDAGLEDLALFGTPWPVRFADVTVSATLWQGHADRIVPIAAALALGRALPNAVVHELPAAGHFWLYDNVELVLGAIDRAWPVPP